MGLQIGQITLDRVAELQLDGDRVRFSGSFDGASEAAAVLLRDQLRGYVDNPDEPWVPVVWGKDSTYTGFYRVLGADITPMDGYSYSSTASYTHVWSAELERFPQGWQAPDLEEICHGGLRANAHSITTSNTRPWHALPSEAVAYGPWTSNETRTSITTASGLTVVHRDYTTTADRNDLFDARTYVHLPAASWYNSACEVYVGGSLRVGRQVPNDPTDWMITNDVTRVSPGATAGALSFEWWDGAAWVEKEIDITFGTGNTSFDDAPSAITVLRNSPECCAIRLTFARTSIWRYYCDLLLRRGARVVEGYVYGEAAQYWGIKLNTVEAGASALTGAGLRANADDANGDRYCMFAPAAITLDTTNGAIRRTATDKAFSFGMGLAVNGGSATDPLDVNTLGYAYFSPVAVKDTLVAK